MLLSQFVSSLNAKLLLVLNSLPHRVIMKETDFIDKHKQKWYDFEKMSNDKASDPDKLSELFVQMTEDLSYARTFYPKRSVRVYLNYLAQKVFNSYNKKRKANNQKIKGMTYEHMAIAIALFVVGGFLGFLAAQWQGVVGQISIPLIAGALFALPVMIPRTRDFFFRSVPLEMYRSRKQLLTSFLFFAVAVLIGVISSSIDPEFLRVIVGDYYVDMTLDNIANGDPMAVYKDSKETGMFLGITVNNIRVAFMAFVLGTFFSFGTAFLLTFNGIMLGAFQYFFYAKGLFLTSFLTIWIHGTLEISVIIIAGCAGMVVGNGLLFPKTLTRGQAFQINARRGVKILIGTVPVFIIAGFLEGFVTRHTEMHDLSKWAIIIGSFAFIIGYFVIYPFIVAKRENFDGKVEEKPFFVPKQKIKKYRIRELGGIFYDTFGFYRTKFNQFGQAIFKIILPLNLVYVILYFGSNNLGNYWLDDYEKMTIAMGVGQDFNWVAFLCNVVLFSINIATVNHALSLVDKPLKTGYIRVWFKEIWSITFKTIPFVAIVMGLIVGVPIELSWLTIFILPLFLLCFYSTPIYGFNHGFGKGIKYSSKSWGPVFISFLMMGALCYLFSFLYKNPIIEDLDFETFMIEPIIGWHTFTVFDNFLQIQNIIEVSIFYLIIHLFLPLLIASFGFQFYSMKEKEEAIELGNRLEQFGKTNKMYETP